MRESEREQERVRVRDRERESIPQCLTGLEWTQMLDSLVHSPGRRRNTLALKWLNGLRKPTLT